MSFSNSFNIFQVYKIRVSSPSSLLVPWCVQRRYSDFLQLRSTLVKENPSIGSQLHFPPKRWVRSNLDPAFLRRRLSGLQAFLASVLDTKCLVSSPALLSFLSLDNPPEEQNGLDALRETVKELSDQLKRREQLELELEYQINLVILVLLLSMQ